MRKKVMMNENEMKFFFEKSKMIQEVVTEVEVVE